MDTPTPGTPPPPHGLPSDPSRCRLLGPTALVVQALMGVLVVASLVVKRQLEKRKRPWRIWLWDIGKQLAGQMVIHLLNLVISDQIALAANNNPCSLYFLNVLIDTTIGVLIFFLALKGFTYLFTTHLGYEGFISGQYGVPPRPQFWWKQLVPYLLSIIVMKLLILLPLLLPVISPALSTFAQTLLEWLSPRVQVIFVMAVFPLTMTVIQFCIVDQVIKAGGKIASGDYDEEQGGSGGGGGGAYTRLSTGDSSAFLRPEDTSSQHLAADIPPSKSPVLPSSPLLSASRQSSPGLSRRYGSMTTTRNESMWEAISRERPEENEDEAYSTYVNALGTEDRLDPRNKRSRAPSPDTIMLSPGPFPSSSRFGDEGDQGR